MSKENYLSRRDIKKMASNASSASVFGFQDAVQGLSDIIKPSDFLPEVYNTARLTAAMAVTLSAAGCLPREGQRISSSGLFPTPIIEPSRRIVENPVPLQTEQVQPIKYATQVAIKRGEMYSESDWQKLDKVSGSRVDGMTGINFVDPVIENRELGFYFLALAGKDEEYVVFQNGKQINIHPYTAVLSQGNGDYSIDYVINNGGTVEPFISFGLKNFRPDTSSQEALKKQAEAIIAGSQVDKIKNVTVYNPFTKESITYDLSNKNNWDKLLEDIGAFLAKLDPVQSVRAEELPTQIVPTEVPATKTPEPTVTVYPTNTPEPTNTPLPTATTRPTEVPATETPLRDVPTKEPTKIPPTPTAVKPTEVPPTKVPPTMVPVIKLEPTIKSPEPTKSAEQQVDRGRLPIDAQHYSLSCELASAEICTNWYNQTKAGGKISMPSGFSNFEDYYVTAVGLTPDGDPSKGFCGHVNGWLSTSCDKSSGAGYGVYPEVVKNAIQKLGIPAEAVYLKDPKTQNEEFKKILIDSYNKNQVLELWGNSKTGIEWRKNSEGQDYPMVLGEHCVAGQVTGFDKNGDPVIEISDPLPYGSGSKRTWTFATLMWWMKNMGWVMAIRVG